MDASTYKPFRPEFLKNNKLLYNFHFDTFAKSLPPVIYDAS